MKKTKDNAPKEVDEKNHEANPILKEEEATPNPDLKMENKSLKEQNLRLMAEMENVKRRSSKAVEKAHKYAIDKFAKNLLEVSDSLEMGIKAANAKDASVERIREGMEMTQKVFLSTLDGQGIKMVGTVGDKFDPEKHEAISMVAAEENDKNKILELAQTGWNLNGRLLRPAMVIIGT